MFSGHHYKNHSAEQVVADILHAGTDVGCHEFGISFVVQHAAAALGNGTITMADIEARLAMQFRVRLRLGHFDQLSPLSFIRELDTICTDYAIATSMEGAIQGAVLVKNLEGRSLPLVPATTGSIAVIGPLVNYSEATTGYCEWCTIAVSLRSPSCWRLTQRYCLQTGRTTAAGTRTPNTGTW